MPRLTRAERHAAVHAEALQRFDRIQSALRDERMQCLQDRRFYSIPGAQWEGLEEQFKRRPKFEINKVHLSVIRIINEYRNNRISADFVAKDGSGDSLADLCDGLFRADEQDSSAEEAYDNAFEEAVGGGIGAVRLRAVYENEDDPDDDRQRIRIEPIVDADSSVWFDLDAKRQDKSDAKFCFLLSSMTPQAYIDEYGEDPTSWDKSVSASEFDWYTPDVVYVAEYFVIEDSGEWRVTYRGAGGEDDEIKIPLDELDAERVDLLEATGYVEIGRRKVGGKRVHKYVLSGGGILEDSGLLAGRFIPIVPTYGKRWFVDNVERCMGHVRLAKDAQRLKNVQVSMLAELSAMSPVSKPIFLAEQVLNHEDEWADDGIENRPYLLVNPITGPDGMPTSGPVAYTKPPEIPPARAALLQITEQDMQDILGRVQEAERVVSNVSGKVLELAKASLDMQTYIYVSNLAKCVRRVGEVWLSMAQDIYVEEGREMRTVGSAGDAGSVMIGAPGKDQDGRLVQSNDLSKARMGVTVSVGPSSISRREATIRMLTNILQFTDDPETRAVLTHMAIMNMDGEGFDEMREFSRKKLVSMGAVKPNEQEAEAMAASAGQKGPNDLALEAMANEADAKATKARADVVKTMAEVEKIKAEIEKMRTDTIAELARIEQGAGSART